MQAGDGCFTYGKLACGAARTGIHRPIFNRDHRGVGHVDFSCSEVLALTMARSRAPAPPDTAFDTHRWTTLSCCMTQHSAPNIKHFSLVIWYDWGALVSGLFTVPFTVAAFIFPSGYGRAVSSVMAVSAFLVTAYRVWADERRQLVELEGHLAPRLRLEFDPNQPKFVSVTPTQGGFDLLYVRVLARALSPTVNNCRGYLQRVSQWDGERYVMLFDETFLLPWSYENPQSVQPKQLNHDADAFLDVAWFAESTRSTPSFGLLNAGSALSNRFLAVLEHGFFLSLNAISSLTY
jgi:hypothetical protein